MEIEKTNFKSFNFKLSKFNDFIIKPEEDQEVKAAFDVYWNQNNVYLQATVLPEEEITVTVEDENRNVIANERFHAFAGITFTARAGKSYRITAR